MTTNAIAARLLAALLLALSLGNARAGDFTGIRGTVISFASAEQGAQALAADDDWLAATSEFQRQALMGTSEAPSREAMRRWQGGAAQAWTPERELRWTRALQAVAPAFNALRVPLPPRVLLVASDGREQARAPHTRGNAVILPLPAQDAPEGPDAYLMSHELFHVMSRHAPALATRLYATIGFENAPELQWPAVWAQRRIANPDAPHDRHLMQLTLDGRKTSVMPLLMASRTQLAKGETFFNVMEVRLVEVAVGDTQTRVVMRGNEPVWYPAEQVPQYVARLGGNTPYIIHPEETLADNFAFLAAGMKVRNPELLRRIEAVFKAREL